MMEILTATGRSFRIIKKARFKTPQNIVLLHTATSVPVLNSSTATFTWTAGPYGSILYGFSMNYDTGNTAKNYSYLLTCDGVTIEANNFQNFPSNSSSYDPLTNGGTVAILLPANAVLNIWTYMSGSTTTDGSLGVVLNADDLEQVAQ